MFCYVLGEAVVHEFFFFHDLHLNFHSFLGFQHGSGSSVKFSTKHEDNPFTLNCFMVPRTCLLIFDAGSRRLGSNNFQNSSYREKTTGSARVSRLSFCFL